MIANGSFFSVERDVDVEVGVVEVEEDDVPEINVEDDQVHVVNDVEDDVQDVGLPR